MGQTYHSNNDSQKLYLLGQRIVDDFDKVLHHFEVDIKSTAKMYIGPCPIHGGDKHDAFNFYHTGHTYRGNWYCNTHQCHDIFVNSPIGFVRGMLSKIKKGWEVNGDDVASFSDAVQWCEMFTNCEFASLKVDEEAMEQSQFVNQVNILSQKRTVARSTVTRDMVRSMLQIPSEYYIERGTSIEILDRYDVGNCVDKSKPMANRAVVPVYDDSGKFMVGCTGRSLWDKCEKCTTYHDPEQDCPPKQLKWMYSKWRHSAGLDSNNYLYNYANAIKYIRSTGIVILVESPGNVWRLEEAGIPLSVATFGAKLSDGQKMLLDTSGALTIITLTDPDEAGKLAIETILEKCQDTYTVLHPFFDENLDLKEQFTSDIADMSLEKIKNLLNPIIEKYSI